MTIAVASTANVSRPRTMVTTCAHIAGLTLPHTTVATERGEGEAAIVGAALGEVDHSTVGDGAGVRGGTVEPQPMSSTQSSGTPIRFMTALTVCGRSGCNLRFAPVQLPFVSYAPARSCSKVSRMPLM
jgi:hypothetical protein